MSEKKTYKIPLSADPLGAAMLAYMDGREDAAITVFTNIMQDRPLEVSFLFRDYASMPAIEQKALELCCGHVLDIGAGSGCHSLFLQEDGLEVTALDIAEGAVKTMRRRGVMDVHHANILEWEGGRYDTLLMMMNGIGIVGDFEGLANFLQHAKTLLKPGGQILFDSTDILYAYLKADGTYDVKPGKDYYGRLKYLMIFDDVKGKSFHWLFLAFDLLEEIAYENGFKAEYLLEGSHHDYLARLIVI